MKRRRKGFTLVEILVVIVIITMLATLIVPNIGKQFGKAKVGLARTGIALIETSLQEFLMDCGRFPTSADGGLEALRVAPSDFVDRWDGPYIDSN
ncbi:MAG: prepilin-type N-terminal cleavage/methylation domain-containing protein, partial [Planctomycetes bacterium]|nr:prepilin-type N-terminal cleavage/methylation domain-containing protein [Planctomycetota bacterium]